MQHFAGKLMSILHGNIRKIRHDQVESFRQSFEKIAFLKMDSLESEPGRVFTRQRESVFRNVDGANVRLRKFFCQAECDHSTARPNVQNSDLWLLFADL